MTEFWFLAKLEHMAFTETRGAAALKKHVSAWGAQSVLAKRLGVSNSAVHDWAHGVSRPKYAHRVLLARILGIEIDAWLTPSEAAKIAAPV